jgi:hypothetical protein
MKNKILLAILAVALVFGMTACSDGGKKDTNVSVSGDIIGTWKTNMGGEDRFIYVTTTTWEDRGFDSGYFTAWNNNTATIYSTGLKANVGTVTVKTPTTATVILKKPSVFPGTYEATKVTF